MWSRGIIKFIKILVTYEDRNIMLVYLLVQAEFIDIKVVFTFEMMEVKRGGGPNRASKMLEIKPIKVLIHHHSANHRVSQEMSRDSFCCCDGLQLVVNVTNACYLITVGSVPD